jgi:hypothetical protein
MTLLRLLLAWGGVTLWYFIFQLLERPLIEPAPTGRVRTGWKLDVADALLLTLFAGLWFASLGHGGWVLLFLLVGLLVEGPARFRDGSRAENPGRQKILRLALGTGRIVAAGGILAWLL